ncbi:hypothetical protein BDP81DRAFT_199029 [Colletotrichum phormii]|uniref:Uncharacterized protein n=1 Tax=Colletotrichum phormii TaxID=359342 RepID=A0AAI9ZW00_9PEZI|nr:uncharacterized protein BDP81DRAFT_199029 [Colletotrichum phormii]KAK1639230.1 hypothetical protein BDP81DRAFT_199029 [Colletotrichum phormii]
MNPGGSGGCRCRRTPKPPQRPACDTACPGPPSPRVRRGRTVEGAAPSPRPSLHLATPCDPIFATTPVPPSRSSTCIPFVPGPVSPRFFYFSFYFFKPWLGTATLTRNASLFLWCTFRRRGGCTMTCR